MKLEAPQAAADSARSREAAWIPWLSGATLALAGWFAFAGGLDAPMLLDDFTAIRDNPTLHDLTALDQVLSPPRQTTVEARPILNLSLAVNYALHGLELRGYHVLNVLIHIAGGLLLFGIARRTLQRTAGRPRNGIALAVAGLWLLHPLHVGAVTYLIQRAEALMGLFYLATLYTAIRGFGSRRRSLWYSLSALACLLGMGSKEVMVSAPLVVWLYDRTFVAGSFGAALRQRWPLYASLAATWIPLAVLVIHSPHTGSVGFGGFDEGLPSWWSYLLTQAGVLVHYVRVSFVPVDLVFDHDWPLAEGVRDWLVPGALVAAALVTTSVGLARRRAWSFLAASAFLILAPTSSVLPIGTEVAAGHRMYLPLAALCAIGVGGLDLLLRGRRARGLGVALALLAAASLFVLTSRRHAVFESQEAVWEDVLSKEPENARAHANLGIVRMLDGDPRGAREHLSEALRLGQSRYPVQLNLGLALLSLGEPADAARQFRASLQEKPNDVRALNNLGTALSQLGREAEAASQYRAALLLAPGDVTVRNNLATTLFLLDDVDGAFEHWRRAIAEDPGNDAIHSTLEEALNRLVTMDDRERARELFDMRVRAYAAAGRPSDATRLRTRFGAALELGANGG